MYSVAVHRVRFVHTRSDVVVGASDWYDDWLHVVSGMQTRSDVKVACSEIYWKAEQLAMYWQVRSL